MYLVLIETSGNQRFIFATNKLRENVGASELTFQVGTKIVLQAIEQGEVVKDDWDGAKLRAFLLDETRNKPVDNNSETKAVEVIIATSGKAILLTQTCEKAEEIIKKVTETALREMPGLTIHGAISEKLESNLLDVHDKIGEIHEKLEKVRYRMPSNEQRFLRLPFAAPCSTSGLPASETQKFKSQTDDYSLASFKKSEAKDSGYKRMQAVLKSYELINPENLEKQPWTAIIHADGNGLGEIFLNFNELSKNDDKTYLNGRDYLNLYRKFSLALDDCTIAATRHAVKKFEARYFAKENNRTLPIVPLVLGGDDLTVLIDGEYALNFTKNFLLEFERQTANNKIINQIASKAFKVGRLSSCAGIAIIKPHFPFHTAYELAEQLLKSAKVVKKEILQDDDRQVPSSAFDYHVLYDSSDVNFDRIRAKLRLNHSKTKLYAKPYVVTPKDSLAERANDGAKKWFEDRHFCKLAERVKAMVVSHKDDDNKRALPNSQLHVLRESLYRGADETDAQANLISHRYEEAFKSLFVTDKTLFFEEIIKIEGKDETYKTTNFLDALEIVEFWK